MDIVEKARIKNLLLQCAQLCGGLTGKYAKMLCSDETIFREMMEDGELRRIPVEIKMPDRTSKKMFLYEDVSKQKQQSFPNLKEEAAKRIAILNNCYCTYVDNTQWLKIKDIKRLASMSEIVNAKLVPDLMCYNDGKLMAFYVRKTYARLTDKEKEIIETYLMVDKVVEYLY